MTRAVRLAAALPDQSVIEHRANTTSQVVLEIVVGASIIGLLVAGEAIRRRWRTSMGYVVVAATLLASGVEVVYNSASDFWYYRGQHDLFTTWGRDLPSWALGSYVPFYGGLGLLGWWLIERGARRMQLLIYMLAVWVFAMVTEIVLTAMDVYRYYGPQPYTVHGFPTWIAMANAAICITVAVGAAALSRSLPTARQWLAVVLGPPVVAAALIGTTFPAVCALHTAHPTAALTYSTGAASVALAFLLGLLVLQLVPVRGMPYSLADRWPSRARAGARRTGRLERLVSSDAVVDPVTGGVLYRCRRSGRLVVARAARSR